MINGSITQRGGVSGSVSGGVGGTTDYNELENRPSINNIILEGNKTGQQLGLLEWGTVNANPDVTGQAIRPLNYIEIKGEYYKPPEPEPFRGATSSTNGTMGLVPAPLAIQGDNDKFLKGDGQWSLIPTNAIEFKDNEQEIDTGMKWIDGKNIYACVIKTMYWNGGIGCWINSIWRTLSPAEIIDFKGFVNVGSITYPINFTAENGTDYGHVDYNWSRGDLMYFTSYGQGISNFRIILYYTKQ